VGDVKCPSRCQNIERTVFLLKDGFRKVITERMEEAFQSLRLIIIATAYFADTAITTAKVVEPP